MVNKGNIAPHPPRHKSHALYAKLEHESLNIFLNIIYKNNLINIIIINKLIFNLFG